MHTHLLVIYARVHVSNAFNSQQSAQVASLQLPILNISITTHATPLVPQELSRVGIPA